MINEIKFNLPKLGLIQELENTKFSFKFEQFQSSQDNSTSVYKQDFL